MKEILFFLLLFIFFQNSSSSLLDAKQSCSGDAVCGDGYCCKFSSACYCSHKSCRETCQHGDSIGSEPIHYGLSHYDIHGEHDLHHETFYDGYHHDDHHDEFHPVAENKKILFNMAKQTFKKEFKKNDKIKNQNSESIFLVDKIEITSILEHLVEALNTNLQLKEEVIEQKLNMKEKDSSIENKIDTEVDSRVTKIAKDLKAQNSASSQRMLVKPKIVKSKTLQSSPSKISKNKIQFSSISNKQKKKSDKGDFELLKDLLNPQITSKLAKKPDPRSKTMSISITQKAQKTGNQITKTEGNNQRTRAIFKNLPKMNPSMINHPNEIYKSLKNAKTFFTSSTAKVSEPTRNNDDDDAILSHNGKVREEDELYEDGNFQIGALDYFDSDSPDDKNEDADFKMGEFAGAKHEDPTEIAEEEKKPETNGAKIVFNKMNKSKKKKVKSKTKEEKQLKYEELDTDELLSGPDPEDQPVDDDIYEKELETEELESHAVEYPEEGDADFNLDDPDMAFRFRKKKSNPLVSNIYNLKTIIDEPKAK